MNDLSIDAHHRSTYNELAKALYNMALDRNDGYDSEEDNTAVRSGAGESLELYGYQRELVRASLAGHNTIICAPTGSGKTEVAVHVIQNHLSQRTPGPKKVVFCARTVPLANQQYERLCKYLSSDFKISLVTGESRKNMSLHLLYEDVDIFVVTPMILVNHLNVRRIKGIHLFSLLVFDECHHTHKEEPYNQLMAFYTKAKKQIPNQALPQIVGLTATIGVDKANDVDEAKDAILQVCANLHAETIATVRDSENIVELKEKTPEPYEDMKELKTRDQDDAVKKILEIVGMLENHARYCRRDIDDADVDDLLRTIPVDKKSQAYCQWTVLLKKAARRLPIVNLERETKHSVRWLKVISDHLRAYNTALESHDLVDLCDVLKCLEKDFADYRDNEQKAHGDDTCYQYYEKLKELLDTRRLATNPNLGIVAETLRQHMTGKHTRAIIFVRTRELAMALERWINECQIEEVKRLGASFFTGSNASGEKGGMTKHEQLSVMEKFRSGELQVLVATSVAEEGLDIPECNLVIRYNHVGNEITTRQTRGRARSYGGFSILLAMKDIIMREIQNGERVKLMEKAIKEIQSMNRDHFRRTIQELVDKNFTESQLREGSDALLLQQLRRVPFKVLCTYCRKVSVDNSNIRSIMGKYRVSIDSNLFDKIGFVRRCESEFIDEIEFTGWVYCLGEPQEGKLCLRSLGKMIRYRKIPFVCFGIKKIDFLEANRQRPDHFSQWKKVPFFVEDLSTENIKAYLKTLVAWKKGQQVNMHVGQGIRNVDDEDSEHSSDDDDNDTDSDEQNDEIRRPVNETKTQ